MSDRPAPTHAELSALLADYDLGAFRSAEPFTSGTVQTNLHVRTTAAECVLRIYGNRSRESVHFEADLLAHLARNDFPCAPPIAARSGSRVGSYRGWPFVVFEYVSGEHVDHLSGEQEHAVLRAIARLHDLSTDFVSPHFEARENYSISSCRDRATGRAEHLATSAARARRDWIHARLDELTLPDELPRVICHADLSHSNLLFAGDTLVALLDFDDANRTWPLFDLAFAIDLWAWDRGEALDRAHASAIMAGYLACRPLSDLERVHLFDVHKLLILFDAIWYMHRGAPDDFIERSKLRHLDDLGRPTYIALFP